MDKRQNGFVRGIWTSPSIKLLIFIDFKSAYNSVFRERLYEALEHENILNKNEVQFLRALHANLHFKVQEKTFHFENGVHQGSPLSPGLFDIYLELVTDEL